MNYRLQEQRARQARNLIWEHRQRVANLRKLENQINNSVRDLTCRQLGLRPGNVVQALGPIPCFHRVWKNQLFVVTTISINASDTLDLLRLASGKKASPKFDIEIRDITGSYFRVVGTGDQISKKISRVALNYEKFPQFSQLRTQQVCSSESCHANLPQYDPLTSQLRDIHTCACGKVYKLCPDAIFTPPGHPLWIEKKERNS